MTQHSDGLDHNFFDQYAFLPFGVKEHADDLFWLKYVLHNSQYTWGKLFHFLVAQDLVLKID